MEEDVIEIYNNDTSPEVDFEINDVIYTDIPSGEIEEMKRDIAQNTADILLRSLITETGNKIDLEINSSTYVLVAKLYDKNNNLLSTSSAIDLPLESMVVDAAYDAQTKEIVLTLKNGNTTRFSIADLVNGLASQDDVDALEERVDIVEDRMDVVEEIMPTVNATGTEITLQNTKKAGMKVALGGNTEQASTRGVQLLNFENGTYSNNGITAVVENGKVTLNGTATATSFVAIPFARTYSSSETLTLSANNEETIGNTSATGDYAALRVAGQASSQAILGNQNAKVTFSLNAYYPDITVRTGSGLSYTNFVLYPQLELGSTATAYEPYTGGTASPNPDYPQTIHTVTENNTVTVAGVNYPINLGTIELCKIGTYQDYIYKSGDKWYLHSKLSKYTFDGTENFVLQNNNKRIFVGTTNNQGRFEAPINEYYEPNKIMYCNKLKQVTAGNTWDGVQGISYDAVNNPSSLSGIDIAINGLTTAEQYRTAITGLIVYYVKQQVTNTEITDTTLISQLEALYLAKSAEGTTTITQTNADEPFILTATAFINANFEVVSNKVTTLSSSSTDTQYPSAKCVYDLVGDIETALEALDVGGGVV